MAISTRKNQHRTVKITSAIRTLFQHNSILFQGQSFKLRMHLRRNDSNPSTCIKKIAHFTEGNQSSSHDNGSSVV